LPIKTSCHKTDALNGPHGFGWAGSDGKKLLFSRQVRFNSNGSIFSRGEL
jgi:hypothetical protein